MIFSKTIFVNSFNKWCLNKSIQSQTSLKLTTMIKLFNMKEKKLIKNKKSTLKSLSKYHIKVKKIHFKLYKRIIFQFSYLNCFEWCLYKLNYFLRILNTWFSKMLSAFTLVDFIIKGPGFNFKGTDYFSFTLVY